ncbi:MAG TPA: hypothetical protein VIK30_03915 [Polyangia bacterium]
MGDADPGSDRKLSPGAPEDAGAPKAAGAKAAAAASCHPDVACPVCAGMGKTIRMVPVKAHYQCPECHYFDSCCM